MSVDDVLKRIEKEQATLKQEAFNAQGLLRLRETMLRYDGEFKVIWSHDLLEEIKNRAEPEGFKIDMPLFDTVVGGFREQQLITLGGDTGHGKTAMGLFFVEKLDRLNPLVIPLEQSNEELVAQRLGNGQSVPKFLSPRALASRVTVNWIEERVVEAIAKHNTKFVLIDHLGYINDFGENDEFKRENAAYRIGQVVKGIKNIAKKWGVVIMLLVHISQHDEGKPPSREDIKNSSDIAQESDLVMLVWRKNELKKKVRIYENKTMLSIQKNRRTGKNATLGFEFDSATGQFLENSQWVERMMTNAKAELEADEQFEGMGV